MRAGPHAEIAADAVPGAVVEVRACVTELAREGSRLRAGGSPRKNRAGDRNMAFEHAVAVAHLRSQLGDGNGAGDISSGAVLVLGAQSMRRARPVR